MMLDLELFRKTPLTTEPYEHMVLPGFVRGEFLSSINDDFPTIEKGGSFPIGSLEFGDVFRQLAADLRGPDVAAAFAEKFEMDLRESPTTLTVRGRCRSKDGKIHTDSRSKLVTVLVYLNNDWPTDAGGESTQRGGQLRLLRSKNIDDVISEVPPIAGTLVCFRNRENAWHGHTTYEGPRRALQLNWVVSEAAAQRSERRHSRSAFWKNWGRRIGVAKTV